MDKSEDDKSIICIDMGHRNLRLDMFDIRELREYIEHRGSFCRHDPAAYGIGLSYAIKHRPILDNNDEYLDLYTERHAISNVYTCLWYIIPIIEQTFNSTTIYMENYAY